MTLPVFVSAIVSQFLTVAWIVDFGPSDKSAVDWSFRIGVEAAGPNTWKPSAPIEIMAGTAAPAIAAAVFNSMPLAKKNARQQPVNGFDASLNGASIQVRGYYDESGAFHRIKKIVLLTVGDTASPTITLSIGER